MSVGVERRETIRRAILVLVGPVLGGGDRVRRGSVRSEEVLGEVPIRSTPPGRRNLREPGCVTTHSFSHRLEGPGRRRPLTGPTPICDPDFEVRHQSRPYLPPSTCPSSPAPVSTDWEIRTCLLLHDLLSASSFPPSPVLRETSSLSRRT